MLREGRDLHGILFSHVIVLGTQLALRNILNELMNGLMEARRGNVLENFKLGTACRFNKIRKRESLEVLSKRMK